MSIYYALLLPQHVRLTINEVRRVLFCKSGHFSFRAQESCILLGKTDDTALATNVSCPPLPMAVEGRTKYSDNTLFFPVQEKDLELIRCELGVDHPYSGIYLGDLDMHYESDIPELNNLRLALVDIQEEDGVTLWRTLAEKRLQKDKGI